ncbi:hypothetical protein DPMN_095889 [Dreissena polymorpha]|uniref:Uncharacterized protein n=1 Tax=Dreissena polymorpha TaxID=45954 RepID=A0A9D4R494_DREPO|nr:hypothetical protein DPMN_095889 [Dreissena polymorpha]
MYRKSLHKRLLYHKQKLTSIDNMKKSFLAQDQTPGSSVAKQQGKQYWKELTKFASTVS